MILHMIMITVSTVSFAIATVTTAETSAAARGGRKLVGIPNEKAVVHNIMLRRQKRSVFVQLYKQSISIVRV